MTPETRLRRYGQAVEERIVPIEPAEVERLVGTGLQDWPNPRRGWRVALVSGVAVVIIGLALAMLSQLGQGSPPITQPPPVPDTTLPGAPVPPNDVTLPPCNHPCAAPTNLGRFALEEGEIAPPFQGTLLGGGSFDLRDLGGQKVVVLLWATECDICVEGLDDFQAVATRLEDRAAFISVVIHDDSAETVARVVEEQAFILPVVIDKVDFRWYPVMGGYVVLDEEGRALAGLPGTYTNQNLLIQALQQFLD